MKEKKRGNVQGLAAYRRLRRTDPLWQNGLDVRNSILRFHIFHPVNYKALCPWERHFTPSFLTQSR